MIIVLEGTHLTSFLKCTRLHYVVVIKGLIKSRSAMCEERLIFEHIHGIKLEY